MPTENATTANAAPQNNSADQPLPASYMGAIDIAKGIEYTTAWRNSNDGKDFIQAFFILREDIASLYSILYGVDLPVAPANDFIGCRAYIGKDEQLSKPGQPASGLKLLLVPVKSGLPPHEQVDIIEIGGTSTVFDFSKPCPSTCDHLSILMTGQQ